MTRDEHTTNRPTPGGSAFQETGMDDYLTRVAGAVRDATLDKAWQIGSKGPLRSAVKLPEVIASVPRPEPVAWLFRHPVAGYLTVTDSGNATDDGVFPVYAEPVAVPDGWKMVTQTAAARDVLAERQRQVSVEGWTPAHDDCHVKREMACAAACYALPEITAVDGIDVWPWEDEWWKPRDHRSNLIRAGALILAEIERLDRARGAQS